MSVWPLHLLLLVGCLLGPLPGDVGAEDPGGDPAAFDKSMKRMVGYLKREKFAKGLRELTKLLAQHEEKPYVRARRAEIEDLVRRYCFGARYQPPTASDVLAGSVERYDPDTGKLKVRYTPNESGDFRLASNGTTEFFADTMGPFSLQVWGRSMPGRRGRTPWMEFSGGLHPTTGKSQVWHVDFGSPAKLTGAKTVYRPATIQYIDGGERKNVSTSHAIHAKEGRPFVVQISVGSTSIQSAVNGKLVGRARKHKGEWGWIRFAVPGWTKLVFSGVIEPAYIQARLDKVVQGQLREFRKNYKRSDHLPAWLFKKRAKVPAASRPDLPVEVDKQHWSEIRNFKRHMKAGAWVEARTCLDGMAGGVIPEAVVKYLSARLRLEEDEPAVGLQEVEAALKTTPDFVNGVLLQGRLLGELKRGDDALTTFLKALALEKDDVRVYEHAAEALLMAGRADAVQKIVEQAARNQVDSSKMDMFAALVIKATRGPSWSRVYEAKTRNYHVFSDIGKRTCLEAAKLLEEALTSYRVNFKWVARDTKKLYPVYLFSGQWGFNQYVADVRGVFGTPDPMTLGIYSPAIKQLIIWNQPEKKDMLDTIRHEGFHQYIDRFAGDMPVWLNEGLATYHMTGARKRGRLKFGAVHPLMLVTVKKAHWVPLDEYIFESRTAFRARGYAGYAQAWLLVHMLMQGKARWRSLMKALVKDFGTLPARVVMRKHFTPEIVAAFEHDARSYISAVSKKKR